jgi:hypothetical protein
MSKTESGSSEWRPPAAVMERFGNHSARVRKLWERSSEFRQLSASYAMAIEAAKLWAWRPETAMQFECIASEIEEQLTQMIRDVDGKQ